MKVNWIFPYSAMNRRLLLTFALSLMLTGLSAATQPAAANTLIDLRVGPHKRFDRVVFEFQAEAQGRVSVLSERKIEVRFTGAKAREGFKLPTLPRGLSVIEKIDAFREGEADLVFEIVLAREATPSELPLAGATWRLAVDLAPRMSEKQDAKPDYVPGDRPIPTKFAEAPHVPEVATPTEPMPQLAGKLPQAEDSLDPAQRHAILAFYYLSSGDSVSAAREAERYRQLRGETLELLAETPPQTAAGAELPLAAAPPFGKLHALTRMLNLPVGSLLAVIFGIGLLGGLLLKRLAPELRIPLPRLPKFTWRRKAKTDRSAELSADMEALDDAVAQEPSPKPRPKLEAAPPADEELAPVEVPDAEEQAKDSLMDRRVRRVLELTREGRNVADIAEELQMGQDEVKLILDLNK